MKMAINKCYGGFGLSMLAYKRYLELQGKEAFFYKQTKYSFRDGFDEYEQIENLEEQESGTGFYCQSANLGKHIRKLPNDTFVYLRDYEIRTDPLLIQTIEELGDKANGQFSKLRIVEIPDGIEYEIDDYDGIESVHEKHRSW